MAKYAYLYLSSPFFQQSAVTHKPYAGSLKSVTAKWSPKGVKDTVTFSATIVHSFPIFWVGVESESVKLV